MDCSGAIVYVLDQMGYEAPKWINVTSMLNGKYDWICFFPNIDNERQGTTGILNFYQFENEDIATHVNVGVGVQVPKGFSEPFLDLKSQIIDAASPETNPSVRNGRYGQVYNAANGRVNQTYAPFFTNPESSPNKTPVMKGYIDWNKLKRKQ